MALSHTRDIHLVTLSFSFSFSFSYAHGHTRAVNEKRKFGASSFSKFLHKSKRSFGANSLVPDTHVTVGRFVHSLESQRANSMTSIRWIGT